MTTVFMLTVLILFLGAIIQGVVGFGIGLFSIPFLLMLYDPIFIIPVMVFVSVVFNGFFSIRWRKDIRFHDVKYILLGAVIGVPLGIQALKVIPKQQFLFVAELMIAVSGILYLLNISIKIKSVKKWAFYTGIFSGSLSSSLGTGGPPIVLFFNNQGTKKLNFKSNLAIYFFLVTFFSLPIYIGLNLLDWTGVKLSLICIAPIFFGGVLGEKITSYVPQKIFQKTTLIMVVFSGLWLTYQSLGN